MLTEDEIIEYGIEAEKIMEKAQNDVFAYMIRKLSALYGVESLDDIDMADLLKIGINSYMIKLIIDKALKKSETKYQKVLNHASEKEYSQYKSLFEKQNQKQESFKDNAVLLQKIKAIYDQTDGTFENVSGTLGIVNKDGFSTLTEYFRRVMSNAILSIDSGTFDYNKVLKSVVLDLSNSGIRWIDYESGWHNRITVAVRRAVMTGLRQMVQTVTDENAKKLNTEYFEVSAHAGARPSHAVWQGKVYTKKQLETICGLGEVTGLLGANCYHTYYPFIKGLSKRNYTDEQLKKWSHPDKKSYRGKEYTEYEARQEMRKIETSLRAKREKIHLFKIGNAKEEDIQKYKVKYRIQMKQYKELAKHFGLHTQLERVYMDGLGRVA